MKITLNIETNDPADLSRIAAALSGEAVTVTTTKPATTRSAKAAESPTPSSAAATTAAPVQTGASASAETATASLSEQAAVPTEADLIAAGNAAVAKVGVGGPDKVKKYIAGRFQKADGSPGTLKLTAENQRAKLLADLQAIGRGEIAL